MFAFRTFAHKLQWSIGLVLCAVLAVTSWLNYRSSRRIIEKQTDTEALKQVEAAAEDLDGFIRRVGMLPTAIAARQKIIGPRPDAGTVPFLAALLAAVPPEEVFGVYLAFEDMRWDEPFAMPWVDRKTFPHHNQVQYDYHDPKWAWYHAPKNTLQFNVTEPYYDAGGSEITMLSLNVPIISEDGQFVGTAGADVALDRMKNILSDIHLRLGKGATTTTWSEYTFLVSREGKIISHPNQDLILSKDFAGEDVINLPDGKLVADQPNGSASVKINGEMRRIYWWQAPLSGWKVILNVPAREILQPVNALAIRSSLIAVSGLGVMLVLVTLVARRMTAPITRLEEAASALEGGNLDPASLSPLASRTDELGGLARTFRSMSEQIQSREKRLAEWNQNLEKTVHDRTAELETAVSEAREAREAAEGANRIKSDFLANMSHELRTPMNAIIGYSEMLTEEAEDLGQEGFIPDLKKIHAAGKHLLSLINDVLDLSKIEAGKMTVFVESFEVQTMLNDVVATILPLVEKNHNTLEVRCSDTIGNLSADLTKVRQTLFNLLSNAAKFTEKGTLTLEAERQTLDGEDRLVFTVRDTGLGMTPEQLTKLFQAFSQADSSTTRKFGGTGLGLAISKKFCLMMGGDISVESAYGKGTSFTFWLPAFVVPVENPSDVSSPTLSPDAPATEDDIDRPVVLVIDDDVAVRDVIQRTLSKEGYEVKVAADGVTGLELARKTHPQVIVLDVMMPGMDGWTVLSKLKSDPDLAAIPVILATMLEDKAMGFSLGAQEFLTKPIDRERLVSLLDRYRNAEGTLSVLIVEDDPATQELMQRTLKKERFLVRTAENGRIALDEIAKEIPAFVLLDLMMPVMDGFEFLQILRRNPDWQDIPVVVLTAKDLTDADRKLLFDTVEKILQKGETSRTELLREIRGIVPPAKRLT